MAPQLPDPRRLVGIADRFSRALDQLENRSRRNIVAIIRWSLDGVLRSLRLAYRAYVMALGPVGRDPAGNPIRRPGEYSAVDAAQRWAPIVQAAAGFLTDVEIRQWQILHERDLTDAARLGGELGARLAVLAGVAEARPFTGADPVVIRAAAQVTGSLIQGEGVRFRESLTQIVSEGATRGWGPKRLEGQIRQLLRGTKGQRLGLEQRAALIARSELANVYAQGTLARARDRGDAYVRVLASNDERVCPTCAARNCRVYPTDRLVLPFHDLCRCIPVPVPDEAVQETDPELQDTLLDSERWRDEHNRGVEAFARAKGLTMEQAQTELARALRTPTAAEKRMFPRNPLPLAESVGLFRSRG